MHSILLLLSACAYLLARAPIFLVSLRRVPVRARNTRSERY